MLFSKKHLLAALAGIVFSSGTSAQDGSAPSGPPVMQRQIDSLTRWTDHLPQEKVYLHTDKPYYATGDTIWFKAYTVIGPRHKLSALSGAVYVELIDETGSISKELKLPLLAGTARGCFPLSEGFKEGNYRLRAYTQWMRNAGPEYFYDVTFPVGNAVSQTLMGTIAYQYTDDKGTRTPLVAITLVDAVSGTALNARKVEYAFRKGMEDYTGRGETDANGLIRIQVPEGFRSDSYVVTEVENQEGNILARTFPVEMGEGTDVQFFPEGGELVNGLASRVAFKATGPGGRGVPVSGVVLNRQNDTLAQLTPVHAGMGSFTLTPRSGDQYRASITFPDGTTKEVALPAAQGAGIVLWAYPYRDDETLLLRIMAGPASYGKANLLLHHGGEVLSATSLNINRPLSSLRIPSDDFPSGITAITLFDEQNRPLCERLVFLRRADTLQLAVSATGSNQARRGHTTISLAASDREGKPVSGTFSAAVVDQNKVPAGAAPEHTIFSQLLLRSDIRGYVEDPAWYFRGNDTETSQALDLLMMTQGYRRFTWKDLLEKPLPQPEYRAEDLLIPIGGKLLTLGGKPVEGGQVTLFSLSGVMRDTTTDENGRFDFGTVLMAKDISFSVQGRNARGGKNVEVVMDPISSRAPVTPNPNAGDLSGGINQDIKAYLANSRARLEDLKKHGMTEQINMLEGVTVTAKRDQGEGGIFAIPEGSSDQTLRFDQPGLCASLIDCLQGRLHGVTFKREGGTVAPYSRGNRMAVVLNGRMISEDIELSDILENNGVDPADVTRVDVVRTNLALMSLFMMPNVSGESSGALIITTRSGATRPAPYSPEMAHYAPRGFDTSREFYSPRYDAAQKSPLTDFRSTIHWAPDLITTKNGKTEFDFFNADQPGVYRVVIEGIGGTGELGRAVLRYEVQ